MPLPLATVLFSSFLSFFCVISFAVTSFGGAIIFQLGWNLCNLVSDEICSSNLATPLAMMSLGAFIQLPLQVIVLWKFINIPLTIRFTIYQSIGTTFGVYLLVRFGADFVLRRALGCVLALIAVWFLRKEVGAADSEAEREIPRNISVTGDSIHEVLSMTSLSNYYNTEDNGTSIGQRRGEYMKGKGTSEFTVAASNNENINVRGVSITPSNNESSWSIPIVNLIHSKPQYTKIPDDSSNGNSGSNSYHGNSSSSSGGHGSLQCTKHHEVEGAAHSDRLAANNSDHTRHRVTCSLYNGDTRIFSSAGGKAEESGLSAPFQVTTMSMELYIMVTGLSAGLLGGLYGTSGPPLMVFLCATKIGKDEWRATTAAAHFFENLVRSYFVFYAYNVVDLRRELPLCIGLTVAIILGLTVGDFLASRVSSAVWSKIILFFMMFASSALISADSGTAKMTVSLATSLVTFALTFTGVVSFAVTAFGGDIIFQLGWQMCSIVAPNVCSGHLLVTLGMMSLLGFIKLPIQLLVLRADVNYQLGIRMAIYQITGVTLGLYILTTFGSDLLFKKMFGLFLFFLAVWYLRKELEVYHNASHPVVKPGYEATSDFPTDLEMRSSFLGAFPSSPSSSHSLSPSPSNEDKMPSRSYDNKDYDKEDTNLVPRLPRTMTSYTEGDNYIELKDGKVVSLETPRTSKRRSQLQIDTVSMELKVACFGLMSGILGGIYGTGGPPLMVFASSTGINKDEWRATSAFCHSFENIVRAYYVIYIRRVISFNDERFLLVGLTVTVLLGLLVGNLLSGKVSAALWRQIILLLLMMGSAAMMSAGSPGQEALGLFVLVVTSYALLFLVFRHSYDVALYLRVRSALGIEKGLPFPR